MTDYVKEFLKNYYNYKDDDNFDTSKHSFRPGALYLRDMMRSHDDALIKLVMYIVNTKNLIKKMLAKNHLKKMLVQRKKVPGNLLLENRFSRLVISIDKVYNKLLEGVQHIKMPEIEALGVRPILHSCIDSAETAVRMAKQNALDAYQCHDELKNKLQVSADLLAESKRMLSEIPDVSSETAVKNANEISRLLKSWVEDTLLEAIEDNNTESTACLNNILSEINTKLDDWGKSIDENFAKNPLEELPEAAKEIANIFGVPAPPPTSNEIETLKTDLLKKRTELLEKKRKNNSLLQKITASLSEYPEALKNTVLFKSISSTYSSRNTLIRRLPASCGNDYLKARCNNETDFSDFANAVLVLLEHSKTEEVLENLKKITNNWLNTKSSEWRKENMKNSILKPQLIDRFKTTLKDFETVKSYGQKLHKTVIQNDVSDQLKTLLGNLENCEFSDTKSNAKVAEQIVNQLAKLRNSIIYSGSVECKKLLDDIEKNLSILDKAQQKPAEFKNHNLKEFSEYIDENKELSDQLDAAIFMLETEFTYHEFHNELKTEKEKIRRNTAEIEDSIKEREKKIQLYEEAISNLDALLEKANDEDVLKIDAELNKIEEQLDEAKNEKTKFEIHRALLCSTEPSSENDKYFEDLLKKIAGIFSKSEAKYTSRAKAVINSGVANLKEKLINYKTLMFEKPDGFEEKLENMAAEIEKIIKIYGEGYTFTAVSEKERNKVQETKTDKEKAVLHARAEEIRRRRGKTNVTPEPEKTPEEPIKDGRTTNVNTEAEINIKNTKNNIDKIIEITETIETNK